MRKLENITKNKMKILYCLLFTLLLLANFYFSYAATNPTPITYYTFLGPITEGEAAATGGPFGRVIAFLVNAVYGMTAATAIIMVVISGFQLMSAQGNPKAIAVAKQKLTTVFIGLTIVITSYAMISLFISRALKWGY